MTRGRKVERCLWPLHPDPLRDTRHPELTACSRKNFNWITWKLLQYLRYLCMHFWQRINKYSQLGTVCNLSFTRGFGFSTGVSFEWFACICAMLYTVILVFVVLWRRELVLRPETLAYCVMKLANFVSYLWAVAAPMAEEKCGRVRAIHGVFQVSFYVNIFVASRYFDGAAITQSPKNQ